MKWFEEQYKAVKERFPDQKTRFANWITWQTWHDLRLTVQTFLAFVPWVLKAFPGVYILARKLNQNRLESFFAFQRKRLGSENKPTVEDYGHGTFAYMIQLEGAVIRKSSYGMQEVGLGVTPQLQRHRNGNSRMEIAPDAAAIERHASARYEVVMDREMAEAVTRVEQELQDT